MLDFLLLYEHQNSEVSLRKTSSQSVKVLTLVWISAPREALSSMSSKLVTIKLIKMTTLDCLNNKFLDVWLRIKDPEVARKFLDHRISQ